MFTFYSICAHRLISGGFFFFFVRFFAFTWSVWATRSVTHSPPNILLYIFVSFRSLIRRSGLTSKQKHVQRRKTWAKNEIEFGKNWMHCDVYNTILYSTIHALWVFKQFECFRCEKRLSKKKCVAVCKRVGHRTLNCCFVSLEIALPLSALIDSISHSHSLLRWIKICEKKICMLNNATWFKAKQCHVRHNEIISNMQNIQR